MVLGPLSPQACERLIEAIDEALERKTPTSSPTFVTSDELRAWVDGWKHDRQLLLFARALLREAAQRMRDGGLP